MGLDGWDGMGWDVIMGWDNGMDRMEWDNGMDGMRWDNGTDGMGGLAAPVLSLLLRAHGSWGCK